MLSFDSTLQKTVGSNFDPETGYPDFFVVFLSPSMPLLGQYHDFENYCLFGCDAVQYGRYVTMFHGNMLPQSSYNGFTSQETAISMYCTSYQSERMRILRDFRLLPHCN
jgi:hypothetical protein